MTYSKRLKNFYNSQASQSLVTSYDVKDVFSAMRDTYSSSVAKFDESFDIVFNTGLDPKNSSHSIKSFVNLPIGFTSKVNVLVFATGLDVDVAKSAGANIVVDKSDFNSVLNGSIKGYDLCLSTDVVLQDIRILAKLLGPKGLMPNAKQGTLVSSGDLAEVISLFKSGRRSFFVMDKFGSIKLRFGKFSMSDSENLENLSAVIALLKSSRPSTYKGAEYIKSAFVSTTMGSSFKLNIPSIYSL